ncbi:MAG: PD-(D/E)XK nuclease family transposase [Spirochaetales bacterium]|nr:PD-(D/E)XK nuclease family transposase [Spirochaetales bacterium]
MSKYINPYTDFGFKKLFGTEANKDILIDFLNELVNKEHKIKNLTFKNTESLGALEQDRKAIFDIYCETISGEKIIIEMQKAKINFFKDRAVFYTTFPIKEQAEKGNWSFELRPVYCIAILDFEFDKGIKKDNYRSDVTLKNQYCEEFYNKLKYIFIEMPKFNKKENELETHFEKWLYFLKHLADLDSIPNILKEKVFEKGFKTAEIAALDKTQHEAYEKNLLQYWEMTSAIDTAFEDGIEQGIEKGIEKGIEQEKKRNREFIKQAEDEKQQAEFEKIIIKLYYKDKKSIDEIANITGKNKESIKIIIEM